MSNELDNMKKQIYYYNKCMLNDDKTIKIDMNIARQLAEIEFEEHYDLICKNKQSNDKCKENYILKYFKITTREPSYVHESFLYQRNIKY